MGTPGPVAFEAKDTPATSVILKRQTATIPVQPSVISYGDGDIAARFEDLTAKWRAERRLVPSTGLMAILGSMHYQRIIALGDPAIPLILKDLMKTGADHWGWALEVLTGANPVPPEAEGDIRAIGEAWLAWGRDRGLV